MKKVINLFGSGVLLFATIFMLNSCNNADTTKTNTDSTAVVSADATPAPVAPASDKLTDPEIASVAVTANQIDIDYAAIAKSKGSTAAVKEFAATMAKDHQAVIDKAVALVTKLGVTPADNATTQSLLAGATTTKANLNSLSGAAFDKAYIDNEVAYHKAAIDLVENKLIADASNADLKALLESALPLFKEHLAHAEMVQKGLK
jgi:putative membrane protein